MSGKGVVGIHDGGGGDVGVASAVVDIRCALRQGYYNLLWN